MLLINEEQNHLRLAETIKTKDNQLGGLERDRLIEHGKKIGVNELLKQKRTQKSNTQNRNLRLKKNILNISIEIRRRCYHIA